MQRKTAEQLLVEQIQKTRTLEERVLHLERFVVVLQRQAAVLNRRLSAMTERQAHADETTRRLQSKLGGKSKQ